MEHGEGVAVLERVSARIALASLLELLLGVKGQSNALHFEQLEKRIGLDQALFVCVY